MSASERWAAWMLGVSLLLVPVVAVLAAWTWLRPRTSPQLLYGLWLLALLRLVVPPEFSCPTGWGWWLRPQWSAGVTALHLPESSRAEVVGNADAAQAPLPVDGSTATLATETQTVLLPGGQGYDQRESTEAAGAGKSDTAWCLLLMLAWLGVVAARLGMLTTAALQVRVWVARAPLIQDAALWELATEACRRVGLRRPVELRNSDACATPLVVGWWRPVVLLPATVVGRLDRRELLAVLVHELHHVRRGDPLVSWAQSLLGAAYSFHPLVWWSNRQLQLWREEACDELTVATLRGQRGVYGRALVKVAEIVGYVPPPVVLGMLDSPAPARQRLARILDGRAPADVRSGWLRYLPVLALAAVLLPGGLPPRESDAAANANGPGDSLGQAPSGPMEKADAPDSHPDPSDKTVSVATQDTVASVPAAPPADSRLLCYRWQPAMRFAYACQIDVDHISWQEIFVGTTRYAVESVDDRGAVLVMTGRLRTRYGGNDLPSPLPHERRFDPRSPYNALAGSGTAQRHRLRVSARGACETLDGDSQLPYYLGDLATLMFAPAPEAPADSWSSTASLILRIGDPEPLPPSLWPSRGPAIEVPDARVTSTYTVQEVADGVVTLEKRLALRSIFDVRGEPEHEVTGTATLRFGLSRGLPLEYRASLVVIDRMADRVERTPATITCRLEPDSLSSSAGEKQ
jgi:beta-lactamase regulating signal transducer with metallopeptidase domain